MRLTNEGVTEYRSMGAWKCTQAFCLGYEVAALQATEEKTGICQPVAALDGSQVRRE